MPLQSLTLPSAERLAEQTSAPGPIDFISLVHGGNKAETLAMINTPRPKKAEPLLDPNTNGDALDTAIGESDSMDRKFTKEIEDLITLKLNPSQETN